MLLRSSYNWYYCCGGFDTFTLIYSTHLHYKIISDSTGKWESMKNGTRWVSASQHIPLFLNHHVPYILLWNINMGYLLCCLLRFHHPYTSLQGMHIYLYNHIVNIIIYLYQWFCYPKIRPNLNTISPSNSNVSCIFLPNNFL